MRANLIRQIQDKMASIEQRRSKLDPNSIEFQELDHEMAFLRNALTDAMNAMCPLIKGESNETHRD